MQIEPIGAIRLRLGEGPLWDGRDGRLYWVDAMEGILHHIDCRTGDHAEVALGRSIGAVAARASGGLVAALEDGFYAVDPDTGETASIAPVFHRRENMRLNDAKPDRQGRVLAGSAHITRPADGVARGELYSLGTDGTAMTLDTGFMTCNGPCFSLDGSRLYVADSGANRIYVYDYDGATGLCGTRQVFAETDAFDSPPDGATVDSEDHLWSAMVLAGTIVRYAPDGAVDRVVPMPVRHPSSVAFGGEELDTLYVTSIAQSPRLRDDGPYAGALFAVTGLGASGVPEPEFGG